MTFLLSLLFIIFLPFDAWAFVSHEYPAIYVHMLSSLFCLVALLVVLWAFIRRGLYKERRWKYLFLAAIFHTIWNADVIIGRLAEAFLIEKTQIIGGTEGWHYFARRIVIEGAEYCYYIGRLDFILLNAAMLFFYIWLREHLRKEPVEGGISAAALLPLFPILFTEMAGNVLFFVLSTMCLFSSIQLYKRDRENVLWKYMVGLSSTYFMFSISRSFGHILKNILVPTGNQGIWDSLYLEAIGGSLNTFIRFLVGTLTLFFVWIYETYLGISEDKRKLQASVEERTNFIEQLERDKTDLQELDRMKSAFMANMSHELRTPMNTIIGYSEMLIDRVDGPLNKEQEGSLKKVRESARHLLKLIDDVLNISRIESAKMHLEIKGLNMKNIVESVIPAFDPLIAQKGLTLSLKVSEQLPAIYGDEEKIKQILTNLLSNAVKFTHTGGITITASVSDRDGNSGEPPLFLEICIADTGIGIKEEDLGKIFDKFVQVDFTLVRSYEGTGLGLSIAKGLVKLHGGTLRVSSTFGKGSTFCFTLPLKKELFEKIS